MRLMRKGIGKRFLSVLLAVAVIVSGMLYLNMSANAETVKIGTVTATSLYFRNGPGTEYEILKTLYNGDSGTIMDQATSKENVVWYKMMIDGTTGWASSKYIEVTEQTVSSDSKFETELTAQGFPESYKAQLRALHEKYPNWKFEAHHTGLDWDEVIEAESKLGVNTVHDSNPSSWKSTQEGAYNWETGEWVELDSGGWVAASPEIIQYYMDPRNFLDSTYIFQFLKQSYDESELTEEELKNKKNGLADMISGSYLDSDCEGQPYFDVIMEAARTHGVCPYTLSSMMIQEQGRDGSGRSISGTVEGYEGLYNYFNIGAYATSTLSAVEKGLQYAGGGADGTGTSYGRPWDTRVKSIMGGAQYYGTNYVNKGQDTMYLKKFNVQGSNPYTHQYMTNVQGAASEGSHVADAYSEDARTLELIFKIPVYENMPDPACTKPTGDGSPNNRLKTLGVSEYDLTPSLDLETTEFSTIVDYSASSVTVSATAYDSTASVSGTGTKSLNVGTNTVKIVVTAQNGDKRTYTITIIREEGEDEVVKPSVSSSSYKMDSSANIITGISKFPVSASDFAKGFSVTNGSIKIVKADGTEQTGTVGTGNKANVYDSNGKLQFSYDIIIYGDVSGDGKVNALDLLRVQKNILGTTSLTGAYKTAADTSKNGKIDALDLLQVQKHIIGVKKINQ